MRVELRLNYIFLKWFISLIHKKLNFANSGLKVIGMILSLHLKKIPKDLLADTAKTHWKYKDNNY